MKSLSLLFLPQDCCSELEALGAGAPHAQTKAEKESQISRDIPRTSFKILEQQFGCAMGENDEENIREKLVSKVSEFMHMDSKKKIVHT